MKSYFKQKNVSHNSQLRLFYVQKNRRDVVCHTVATHHKLVHIIVAPMGKQDTQPTMYTVCQDGLV